MADAKPKKGILEFALILAAAYLISQFVLRIFFPEQPANPGPAAVTIAAESDSVRLGTIPSVVVRNGTAKDVALKARCPQPPFDVYRVQQPGTPKEKLVELTADDAVDCVALERIAPGADLTVSLAPWKYALFSEPGTYEVRLQGAEAAAGAARFSMYQPGALVRLYRTFITKPFLNALVFIASVTPGYSLGIAVIVLTIVVKLLLYFPMQKSLEGQRKMQLLQPKIDELKKKYKDDQATLQTETMKLWKEHKVNPFSSCLPILIQLPILIGLFYVIQDGSNLALSRELLYPMYQSLPWQFGTRFLGMDLTKPEYYVMPALLVLLQYWQMRLSFAKKKKAAPVLDAATGKPAKQAMGPEAMQQQIMQFALPLMIGFFAFQFPAAVSLYYGVSTIMATGQQMLVNRKG